MATTYPELQIRYNQKKILSSLSASFWWRSLSVCLVSTASMNLTIFRSILESSERPCWTTLMTPLFSAMIKITQSRSLHNYFFFNSSRSVSLTTKPHLPASSFSLLSSAFWEAGLLLKQVKKASPSWDTLVKNMDTNMLITIRTWQTQKWIPAQHKDGCSYLCRWFIFYFFGLIGLHRTSWFVFVCPMTHGWLGCTCCLQEARWWECSETWWSWAPR